MKKLILSVLLLAIAFGTFSQDTKRIEYIVESVNFKEPLYGNSVFKFPRLKNLANENNEIVEKINAKILSGLNLNSYNEEDLYSQEDRDEMNSFKWSDLEYSSEIKDDILYLNYSFFYLHSYSMYFEETFYFDLKSGEELSFPDVPFHELFTLSGYLDFINQYWLDSVQSKFNNAIECAGGEEELSCGLYDIDSYHIDSNKLSFSLSTDCFPHYIQACTPFLTVSVELDSLAQYLNDIGRYMLIESNYFSNTPIDNYLENSVLSQFFQNNKFIFAKIDNKYPVSIAINIDEDQITGYYYYDKNRVNLLLKGKKENNLLSIIETDKNKITGSFEFKLNPDNGYIESGTWSNPKKTKTYDIIISEIK